MPPKRPSVVTLGTFDGVHKGHQAILRRVVVSARHRRAQPIALAFQMPPRHAGAPVSRPVLLTTFAEKLARIRALGIRRVEPLVFDRRTANTSAHDFFQGTLRRRLRAAAVVVGPRVAFGRHREGRLGFLRRIGRKTGTSIQVISPVRSRAGNVSSRRIRRLLEAGHLESAEALLGYPYSAEGKVIHGSHRGRRLGFPTANLEIPADKILPPGVSWVRVQPASTPPVWNRGAVRQASDGLCNVGTRPTFGGKRPTRHCEVLLLGKSGNFYGRRLRVVFLHRLRPERRFRDPQALARQIQRDLVRVERFTL